TCALPISFAPPMARDGGGNRTRHNDRRPGTPRCAIPQGGRAVLPHVRRWGRRRRRHGDDRAAPALAHARDDDGRETVRTLRHSRPRRRPRHRDGGKEPVGLRAGQRRVLRRGAGGPRADQRGRGDLGTRRPPGTGNRRTARSLRAFGLLAADGHGVGARPLGRVVGKRPRAVEVVVNEDAWRRRRVLVTGHTGFKGAWLSLWLEALGAQVTGLSLEPPTSPSMHALLGAPVEPLDVRDAGGVEALVRR